MRACWMDDSLGVLSSSSKSNSKSWNKTLVGWIRTRWINDREDLDVFFLMSPVARSSEGDCCPSRGWWLRTKSARDGATVLLGKGMVDRVSDNKRNHRRISLNASLASSVEEQGHNRKNDLILLLDIDKWLGLALSVLGTRQAKVDCWRQT